MTLSRRLLRPLLLLLATLLAVPLAALVGVAPAHAASGIATGTVVDGLGDPVTGVSVKAYAAPTYATVAQSTTTSGAAGAEGTYGLGLSDGTYRLEFSKTGFASTFYGGGQGVDVVVQGGQLLVDDEEVVDNELEPVELTGTTLHTVSGVVTSGTGPLAGITVDIVAASDEETVLDTATTNGSGGYALQVPTGVYHVRFTDAAESYTTAWYGGTEPEDVIVSGDRTLNPVTLTKPAATTEYPIAGSVLDALGEAVAGVDVSVTPVGASTDSGTGTTDATGAYEVRVLPGTYQVGYTKTGWTSTKYGGQASPSTVTVGNTGTLSVTPAEELTGNHLGDVTLASSTFAVNGTVETSGGAGIAGITVRAFPEGSTDPADVVDTDTSGAGGAYALTLPVGSYDLEYADNDGNSPTYTTTSLAQVQIAQGGVLTVGGGAPTASLPDVAMALSSADTPRPVLGSLVDVNGAEIDGLTVSAVPQGATPGVNAASDTTGADGGLGEHGRYRLMLKPGSYQVEVDGGADWGDTTYTGEGSSAALVTVQLNGTVLVNGVEAVGGELGATEVVGTSKHTLSGTVREGATGLVGITVKAYAEADPTTPVATATSGANGAWTLTGAQGLVVGTYVIEFSGTAGGSTYDRTWYGGSTPTPVEMAQQGIAKVAGSPVASNTLAPVPMTRSSADTPHPVSGEVVDVNGDPVPGVTVTPAPQAGSPSAGTATTDDDGRYTLMLKPGTYGLGYARTGFTPTSYSGTGTTPVAITVGLDGSAPTLEAVTLADATGDATISGTVVAASGGAGIGGIHVEVFPEGDLDPLGRVAEATTAANGSWSVTTLKIGTYTVRLTDTDGTEPTYVQTYVGGTDLASASPVKVGQADAVTVNEVPQVDGALGETAMTAATSDTTYDVTGTVTDANGDPIVGATVTPRGGPTTTPDTTDADGAFTLALKPGTYQIGYAAAGFTGADYPGSGETAVNVVVQAGGTVLVGGGAVPDGALDAVALEQTTGTTAISGSVTSGGSAVQGITVEVFPEGDFTEAALKTVTTAANGSWSVTALRIGTYTVRFTDNVAAAPTYVQTTLGPVKVGQGASDNVHLDDSLKPDGALGVTVLEQSDANTLHTVTGEVVDANFEALQGVTVTAEPQPGSPAADPATTDEDGAYVLRLKAGTYKVKFARTDFATAYYRNAEDAEALVVVAENGVVRILGEVVPDNALDSFSMTSTVKYPLTGTVVSTGAAPIPGITARALVDGVATTITTTTAGNGTFTLQLPVGTYTIEFVDTVPAAPSYITTTFGGTTPTQVKVSTNGVSHVTDAETGEPIASAGTITMEAASASTTYDVKGLVFDQTYEPLDGATVRVLPVNATSDSQAVATGTTGADATTGEEHGYYRIPVRAGKYWLKYTAPGHASTYLIDFETGKPAVVTVAASGITSPGFEFVGNQIEDVQLLLPAPKMVTAPKLSGRIAVGEKVTTTVGRWNPNIEQYADWKDYVTIEWFIDGVPADDYSSGYYYQSYKIPAEAAGKRLSYRITIEDANPEGPFLAPIVFTSKPVAVPKATPKLTASYKKGKLTVVVKVAGVTKPLGTITVVDGKKKIGTLKLSAKSKGKAVLKLKKLKPGKHKLTISYSGDATVNPGKTKLKIKV